MPLKIETSGDVIFATVDVNSLERDDKAHAILELEQQLNIMAPIEVFVAGKKILFHPRFHLWEKKSAKKTKER